MYAKENLNLLERYEKNHNYDTRFINLIIRLINMIIKLDNQTPDNIRSLKGAMFKKN